MPGRGQGDVRPVALLISLRRKSLSVTPKPKGTGNMAESPKTFSLWEECLDATGRSETKLIE
ncbi:unnamed protein product, partial [Amoebophrya sp. A25]|eukprot:GSA25T00009666001.1